MNCVKSASGIVRVSSTGRMYGCPLRVSKIHSCGPQGSTVRTGRTYGRSLRPVRTGSVYRPLSGDWRDVINVRLLWRHRRVTDHVAAVLAAQGVPKTDSEESLLNGWKYFTVALMPRRANSAAALYMLASEKVIFPAQCLLWRERIFARLVLYAYWTVLTIA